MSTWIKYILVIILSLFIGGYAGYLIGSGNNNNPPVIENKEEEEEDEKYTPPFSDSTTVTITDKEDPEDPDIVVDNKYTANIDGVTYEIPKVHTDTNSKGQQVQVTHQVDMTPIVNTLGEVKYDRNWSIGSGLGVKDDGDVYIPVSIERQYNYDRSIEGVIGVDTDGHIENVAVLYKIHF